MKNIRRFLAFVVFLALLPRLSIGQIEDYELTEEEFWNDLLSENGSSPTHSALDNSTHNFLYVSFLIVAIVGLLANTVVFFVIFCGNEIGKLAFSETKHGRLPCCGDKFSG